MITILVLLFLSMLDFQHPPKPDNPFSAFVVQDMFDNSATTGCTTNPSQGRAANTMIEVEWINHDDPHDVSYTFSATPSYSLGAAPMITPKVMPYDPPALPDLPEPEMSPVAVVSEPPTAAILGISGVALLYLIFGRNRQKLYRRT